MLDENTIKNYVNEILEDNNGDYRIKLIGFLIEIAEKKGNEFIQIDILKEIINDKEI